MTDKLNLIFALMQVENIAKLVEGNMYEGFMSSHLLPLKYEFERQLSLMNGQTTN
jgi:hypothetical protein